MADAMAAEVTGGLAAPAFLFHLGDVVYNFGEGQYYYDQFYEPFRALRPADLRDPGQPRRPVFGAEPDTPRRADAARVPAQLLRRDAPPVTGLRGGRLARR